MNSNGIREKNNIYLYFLGADKNQIQSPKELLLRINNEMTQEQLEPFRIKTSPSDPEKPLCIICIKELKAGKRVKKLPCDHEFHKKKNKK